ncbi:antibiotic biosynthesis monooxygenase family protein [Bacillus massiliglaciei]|uniref:antibiotic biosynthesis monooxygenase family protein n=1 Tax=Bacillus massiliglaciei TaxID=1816693 RepID=UPI000AEE00B4|nr:antibiotic biosynthesis monooxygenase [Bacillus massiliglaciei]
MFIQKRVMTIKEGFADQVVENFRNRQGIIQEQEGFIDQTVMVKKVRRGDEEVVIMIRWESESHWKQWEKSDAHIQGHKKNMGKPKPDYILDVSHGLYEVKAVKTPASGTEA